MYADIMSLSYETTTPTREQWEALFGEPLDEGIDFKEIILEGSIRTGEVRVTFPCYHKNNVVFFKKITSKIQAPNHWIHNGKELLLYQK